MIVVVVTFFFGYSSIEDCLQLQLKLFVVGVLPLHQNLPQSEILSVDGFSSFSFFDEWCIGNQGGMKKRGATNSAHCRQ